MREDWLWQDGKISQGGQIPISNGGYQHGMGLFETIYFEEGRVYFLRDHLERLRRGAAYYGFAVPFSDQHYLDAVRELSARAAFRTARVKLLLTAQTSDYNRPLLETSSLLLFSPYQRASAPLSLRSVPFIPQRTSRYKTTNYASYILAQRSARSQGAQEALLVNERHDVLECGSGNLFFEIDHQWHTPSLSLGGLPGVQRQAVLAAFERSGQPVKEGSYRSRSIAQRAFMSNALRGIVPIKECDGRTLPLTEPSSLPFFETWQEDARAQAVVL